MRFDSVSMSPSIAVGLVHLKGEPVGRQHAVAHEEAVHRHHQFGVGRRRDLAVIGDLANLPQPRDGVGRPRHVAHVTVARSMFEHEDVLGDRRAGEPVLLRRLGERGLQRANRREIEVSVAPLHDLERLEGVALQRLHHVVLKWRAAAGGAKGAVTGGAAGTAGDLGKLGRIELAELIAIEFPIRGEGDVIDVKIEAHADGIGGDHVLDIAGLIERDLGVAGAWAERAQHHGGAAALTANELGDGVDLLGRERDNRCAARQPRQLLFAGEGELGQARTRQHMRPGQQPLHHRPHGGGPEHQGFLAATAVEHAVGEHVAAFEIGAQLHFVDSDKGRVDVTRHCLDSGDPEAWIERLDLLLTGDERDVVRAHSLHTFVIDLACEQPQRQPDDPGRMRQHPLDREMGLAGVGRSEHRSDACAAGPGVAVGGGGEGKGHYRLELYERRTSPRLVALRCERSEPRRATARTGAAHPSRPAFGRRLRMTEQSGSSLLSKLMVCG